MNVLGGMLAFVARKMHFDHAKRDINWRIEGAGTFTADISEIQRSKTYKNQLKKIKDLEL